MSKRTLLTCDVRETHPQFSIFSRLDSAPQNTLCWREMTAVAILALHYQISLPLIITFQHRTSSALYCLGEGKDDFHFYQTDGSRGGKVRAESEKKGREGEI